jgi:uncharacterized membrane protein YkvI
MIKSKCICWLIIVCIRRLASRKGLQMKVLQHKWKLCFDILTLCLALACSNLIKLSEVFLSNDGGPNPYDWLILWSAIYFVSWVCLAAYRILFLFGVAGDSFEAWSTKHGGVIGYLLSGASFLAITQTLLEHYNKISQFFLECWASLTTLITPRLQLAILLAFLIVIICAYIHRMHKRRWV